MLLVLSYQLLQMLKFLVSLIILLLSFMLDIYNTLVARDLASSILVALFISPINSSTFFFSPPESSFSLLQPSTFLLRSTLTNHRDSVLQVISAPKTFPYAHAVLLSSYLILQLIKNFHSFHHFPSLCIHE